MPLVMMYFGAGALTPEQKTDLSKKVTDLIVKEAKQPREGTWVVINDVPIENWLVGGLTVAEFKATLMQQKK
jgi:4-oxalocrotonate tautomerase